MFVAVALVGCADEVPIDRGLVVQTPGDDAVVTSHTAGPLSVAVRRPGTIDRGIVRIELVVTESGDPVDQLTIVATSDMPTMDHPQELDSVAGADGRYYLDVPLGMPGDWRISFDITGPGFSGLPPVDTTLMVRPPSST